MIIVSRFDSVWDEKRQGFVIVGTENIPCPDCEGDLKPYDTCKRHVTHLDDEEVGHRVLYVLRRLQCENCKKTHRELPDFIVPYKHYSRKAIEDVAKGKKVSVPYEERTRQKLRAWFKRAKVYFEGVWQQQVMLGHVLLDVVPNFVSLVRATVNSGNWPYHSPGRVCPSL